MLTAVFAFRRALHVTIKAPYREFAYQVIAAMPVDATAVWSELRIVVGRGAPTLEQVAELCALYQKAVTAKLQGRTMPVYDLAAMESMGGVQ